MTGFSLKIQIFGGLVRQGTVMHFSADVLTHLITRLQRDCCFELSCLTENWHCILYSRPLGLELPDEEVKIHRSWAPSLLSVSEVSRQVLKIGCYPQVHGL
jgi:hypothetical protein